MAHRVHFLGSASDPSYRPDVSWRPAVAYAVPSVSLSSSSVSTGSRPPLINQSGKIA